MSQAEELLNGLAMDIPTHDHTVTDDDGYFVIDTFTRTMSNGIDEPNVLMQYDHCSEIYTFEIPRYVDGHDTLLCDVAKVHYNNISADGYDEIADVYEMRDFRINPDKPETVICTWEIHRQATQLVGTLNFLVQYLCHDKDGNVVYEWHTDIYDNVIVKQGRNNGEIVIAEYTDLLEQWRQRVFGAGDSVKADIAALVDTKISEIDNASEAQQEAIALKAYEVLESIPEEYTEVANTAEDAYRTKADAIIRTVNGNQILINDSSDNHLRGLRVFGKTTQVKTTGAQLAKSVHVYTDTRKYASALSVEFDLQPSTTYTISFIGTVGNVLYLNERISKYVNVKPTKDRFSLTFTTADVIPDGQHIDGEGWLMFKNDIDNANPNKFDDLMLNVGDVALPYEPYSGGIPSPSPEYPQELVSVENPSVGVFGNNLLDQHAAYVATGNTAEISKVVNENSLVLTGTPSKNYVQITTGNLTMPITWRGHTLKFGGIVTGNQPHVVLYFRNSSKTIVNQVGFSVSGEKTITVPHEAMYYEFAFCLNRTTTGSAFTATYENLYLIHADVVGGYEPYKTLQQLTITHTLPGIPVSQNGNYTDVNGQQWICDEVDFEHGVYVQRVGVTDFTGATWTQNSNGRYFSNKDRGVYSSAYRVMCSHITGGMSSDGSNENVIFINANNDIRLNITLITNTAEEVARIMTRAILIGVLNTPIETPLTAEELEAFKQLRSNYHNTVVVNDAGAEMELQYNADTKIYVDNIVESARLKLATITLRYDNWIETSYGYYQTVDIDGVTPNSKIDLQPTPDQLASFVIDGISLTTINDNGILTIYAIGERPSSDVTLQVQIVEVTKI